MSTGTSPRTDRNASRASRDDAEVEQLKREMQRIEMTRNANAAQQRMIRRPESTPPNSARRSRSNVSGNLTVHDPPGATHVQPIEPEETRRQKLPKTSYLEMKDAMKASWYRDSTLVSGFFLTRPAGRGGTFGRSERFSKPVGMKEQYYLSNDIQRMQSREVRLDRRRYQVATRGATGTNVNSHWNDSKGGTAPGPGAYTPRYANTSQGPRV
mmetsp:Transcript_815/g.2813  ORF Transcript_815/g.2813 Transcript_815/m.2813 type:complete len:212 (-) Transcript_815:201-836(-)